MVPQEVDRPSRRPALDRETAGMAYGLLGVLAFSLTLPAARVAVPFFGPTMVGLGRALVAAVLAALTLAVTRQPVPTKAQIRSLLLVVLGVVFGFPFLSAWAMGRLPASHGAVTLGLLPLATAGAAALRAGERPSMAFWVASIAGSAGVVVFALTSGGGSIQPADLALGAAVLLAALGYAEGGKLARVLGGWQVISWALVLAAPVLTIPVFLTLDAAAVAAAPPEAWAGFAYVSIFSQFLGFFAWYKGLAMGGVARVGQLQLLQPFFTITGSALLLGESVTASTLLGALVVVAAVAVGRRTAVAGPTSK